MDRILEDKVPLLHATLLSCDAKAFLKPITIIINHCWPEVESHFGPAVKGGVLNDTVSQTQNFYDVKLC